MTIDDQALIGHYFRFYEKLPQIAHSDGGKTWLARGANFIVAVSELKAGGVLERDNKDEYITIALKAPLKVESQGRVVLTPSSSLAIMPPGKSSVVATVDCTVTRVFSTETDDLLRLAPEGRSYNPLPTFYAPALPWPEPVGGYKLRLYDLDAYPPSESRFGRIFRSRSLMINVLPESEQRRNAAQLTPHTHDDFEQGSLVLSGTYIHHLRKPWGKNSYEWMPDEHEECASPSLVIIPPQVVHTSQDIGEGITQLIDIFSPPRMDFSVKDGWVLNADEYPMPQMGIK